MYDYLVKKNFISHADSSQNKGNKDVFSHLKSENSVNFNNCSEIIKRAINIEHDKSPYFSISDNLNNNFYFNVTQKANTHFWLMVLENSLQTLSNNKVR